MGTEVKESIEAKERVVLTAAKRVLIHRQRLCPACGQYKAWIGSTPGGRPKLRCSACGTWTECEWAIDKGPRVSGRGGLEAD